MKNLLKNLIGGAVGAVIVLGIFSYIAYRMLKDELDK